MADDSLLGKQERRALDPQPRSAGPGSQLCLSQLPDLGKASQLWCAAVCIPVHVIVHAINNVLITLISTNALIIVPVTGSWWDKIS